MKKAVSKKSLEAAINTVHGASALAGDCDYAGEQFAPRPQRVESPKQVGWISPKDEMPDDDICVLIRTKNSTWPLALGFRDAGTWRELSSDRLEDSDVVGWMNMEDGAAILDAARKDGAK